jgi:hypothetical protein
MSREFTQDEASELVNSLAALMEEHKIVFVKSPGIDELMEKLSKIRHINNKVIMDTVDDLTLREIRLLIKANQVMV